MICLLVGCGSVSVVLPILTGLDNAAEELEPRIEAAPPGVKPLEVPGIQNLFALGTNVFSGSAPEGEEGFNSLERLGIKTIVTVDGTRPDVETARRHGIRYVHLPHGYDGISTDAQLMLAKAGRELAGPIYVHCHHGRHRGPVAAAVICLADQDWTREQALAFLHVAGTATNYAGLYETIRDFQMPTAEQLQATPDRFPETARVPGLVDDMVEIDGLWDHLKAIRAAGYRTPVNQPDLQPANEAVILWEHFREAQRLPESVERGPDLLRRFRTNEVEVKEAERLLRLFAGERSSDIRSQLDRTFDTITQNCAGCHEAHRDFVRIKSNR